MPFLATSLGFRRWEYLDRSLRDVALQTIRISPLPDEGYVDALVDELRRVKEETGVLPFTGLVTWGISDGARFLDLLSRDNYIELENEISMTYKVLTSFKYLEQFILAIHIQEDAIHEISE